MRRTLLGWIAVFAVVLGSALWFAWADIAETGVEAGVGLASLEQRPGASESSLSLPDDAQDALAAHPQRTPEIEHALVAESVEPQGDGDRTLEGTIVVSDWLGGVHPGETGSFTLETSAEPLKVTTMKSPRSTVHRVQVEGGRWTCEIPAHARSVSVRKIELGGRGAIAKHEPQSPEQLEEGRSSKVVPASSVGKANAISLGKVNRIRADGRGVTVFHDKSWIVLTDGPLALEASWPANTLLRVRGSDGAGELHAIELVHDPYGGSPSTASPSDYGGKRVVEESAHSPLEIVPTESMLELRTTLFWARAEGYAWGRIDLDLSHPTERTLTLQPGGAIDVELAGQVERKPELFMRLQALESASAALLVERPLAKNETRVALESVPVGKYRLSVERGELFDVERIARAEVEVFARGRTAVFLSLSETESTERVELSGTLVLPREWNLSSVRFSVELLDSNKLFSSGENVELFRSSADDEVLPWKAMVKPGMNQIRLVTPMHSMLVDVPPSGRSGVIVRVPPPASVRIVTVDAEGEPFPCQMLMYKIDPAGSSSKSTFALGLNAKTLGVFELKVPVGAVDFFAQSKELVPSWTRFELVPGANDLELRVEKNQGFDLTLAAGEAIIPLGKQRASARRIDGEGKSIDWETHDDGQRITVDRPGRYRVEVPTIDGFLPVPEQEVKVEAGQYTRHRIALERAP